MNHVVRNCHPRGEFNRSSLLVSHFARCPERRISHELSLVAHFARGPTVVVELILIVVFLHFMFQLKQF
jgi:hypothetical protein